MSLAAPIQVTDQDIRSTSTVAGSQQFGQTQTTADGRTFAYGLNGSASVALAPGKLAQGAISVANHVNNTGVTTVAGQQSVSFAVGATLVTQNQYQGGYLVVNAGTGVGQALLIAGNNAAVSSGTVTVNLQDEVITATAVSDSKFSLFPHIYSAALVASSSTPLAVLPLGVPSVSVPASSYAWFQTGGTASVLANGTPGIGVAVIPSATTAGAVDVSTAASFQNTVGYMDIIAVSTQYYPVTLTIATS